MTTISVRLPDELNALLEKIAQEEERSKGFIIKKALKAYLEDIQDYHLAEEAYKRYLNSGKRGHNLQEVAKRLGIDSKDL